MGNQSKNCNERFPIKISKQSCSSWNKVEYFRDNSTSEDNSINRSSCSQMIFKTSALKNFANLTGKHL